MSHDFELESCEAEGESRIRPGKIVFNTEKTKYRDKFDEWEKERQPQF